MLNSTWIDGRSFHSWYGEMVRYLQSVPAYNATLVGGLYPPPARFYAYLTAFLNSSRGEFFHGDVLVSHATQSVTAARFLPLSFNLIELSDQIDAIEDLYAITNEMQPLVAFPFDPNWSFFMTFPAIQSSSHIYLILAFGTHTHADTTHSVSNTGLTPHVWVWRKRCCGQPLYLLSPSC